MKKVRFETPNQVSLTKMDERECHSPRPFIEKQGPSFAPDLNQYQRLIYSNDPVQRYECSDSSPYPMANKTQLNHENSNWMPSNDLDLSFLDSGHEPRQLINKPHIFKPNNIVERITPQVLSPIQNVTPPNVLSKDNSFFIRRENIDKYRSNTDPLHKHLNSLSLDKENDPLAKKVEIMKMGVQNTESPNLHRKLDTIANLNNVSDCSCYHCVKVIQTTSPRFLQAPRIQSPCQNMAITTGRLNKCHCLPLPQKACFHCEPLVQNCQKTCHCAQIDKIPSPKPQNAIDKKTWLIEKFEQSKKNECMDVEKQMNVAKEKREPSVADLFKIIKLQNEQLQLLQEKVDKFISSSNQAQSVTTNQKPIQNYTTEHVALQTIDSEERKISIGVMTSFEMVRTSTVINKEIVKQTKENAQIQCNRSQISIKEVISKSQPVNLNFLDGIPPMSKTVQSDAETTENEPSDNGTRTVLQQAENLNDEKTLNEISLYNVQVDNATTPLISPEQTLYLDVRDYSDSESGSDDQSNVGWTYYNKVMTHVNGMLQDSDMPSSASALYRNTRQQCVQMQFDKTNISVTKRVKFGDDPLGLHQPHIYAGATDTSLKMNQLAAKYLQAAPLLPQRPATKAAPIDMSFATRNYMEKHKLLQGLPATSRSPAGEMPRFLDITALKQQQHNKLL